MRAVVQRVSRARVVIDGETGGEIGRGLLVLLGVAGPDRAVPLYEAFVQALRALGVPTATGRFGAMMQVELVNDGPVTLIVDSKS